MRCKINAGGINRVDELPEEQMLIIALTFGTVLRKMHLIFHPAFHHRLFHQSMDCIFCSIVAGKVPAEIVYSGDRVLAFLDVHPIHPGHILVIPKEHYDDLSQLPKEHLGELMLATQTVAGGLTRSLDLKGFNVFSNNGAVAGQSVFHFHIHITPRYPHDNIRFVHGTREYGPGEMTVVGNRIRQAIRDIEPTKEQ